MYERESGWERKDVYILMHVCVDVALLLLPSSPKLLIGY